MKRIVQIFCILLAAWGTALLDGCASKPTSTATYDFGPVPSVQSDPALPELQPIAIAELNAPAWLDNTLMFYRLSYANEQQPRRYALSHWSMPPASLFAQRLKSRIAQAGGVALSASDGAANILVLRIEAEDFMQVFTSPEQSAGQVRLRASVFNGRALIAQQVFSAQSPASSADAAGGVRALASASDAIIDDMMKWLATLPTTSR